MERLSFSTMSEALKTFPQPGGSSMEPAICESHSESAGLERTVAWRVLTKPASAYGLFLVVSPTEVGGSSSPASSRARARVTERTGGPCLIGDLRGFRSLWNAAREVSRACLAAGPGHTS